MKLLFLCTTEFQLMTALNIKYHLHPNDEADIIVANYHGKEQTLATRIRETGLFHRVCYVREYIEHETLHRYVRGLSDSRFRIDLMYAARNSLSFSKMKLKEKIQGARAYLETMINGFSILPWKEYDAFFAHGTKPVTCSITKYLLQVNNGCKYFLLDEGNNTYMTTTIGGYSHIIDTYYCYAPELMLYNRITRKIPKFRKEDQLFVSILNHVFQFHPSDVEDYQNAIIIFSLNGSEVKMPQYLKINPIFNQTFLRNPYRKHIKEEQEYHEQLRIINLALSYAKRNESTRQVWIKLAPRSSKDQIEEFKGRADVQLLRRWDLPWELLALNCPVGNNILLTTRSGSVCLYNDVIDGVDMDTKRLLLYKLSKSKASKEIEQYCDKLVKKYTNIYIPESEEELFSIL